MTEPFPTPRSAEHYQSRIDALHAALDKSSTRREELCDERLREHHDLRCIHHAGPDGLCVEDGQQMPCRSRQVIDRVVAA